MNLESLCKKIVGSLVLAASLSLVFLSLPANAQTSNDTSSLINETYNIPVDDVNKALEYAVKEVNEQLEKGETKATFTKQVNAQGDTIELGVDNQKEINTDIQAVRKKNYSGYVKFKGLPLTGTHFQHKISGTFTYEKGKIKANSYDVYLTGPLYSKSHDTTPFKLDKSVWEIRSTGTFKLLKYTPLEYTTRLVIGLYGSGDYRVLKAKIN
ncbi:hypothetical protein [Bacillus sp. FSL M8-0168]|uniref:hypothetical protein n=1 Tax=Bacillus sp. FSL M8-0168 TaxID=2921614 RepID=UPI0030FDBAF5